MQLCVFYQSAFEGTLDMLPTFGLICLYLQLLLHTIF